MSWDAHNKKLMDFDSEKPPWDPECMPAYTEALRERSAMRASGAWQKIAERIRRAPAAPKK